jgi:hypothetical protein
MAAISPAIAAIRAAIDLVNARSSAAKAPA